MVSEESGSTRNLCMYKKSIFTKRSLKRFKCNKFGHMSSECYKSIEDDLIRNTDQALLACSP